MAPPRYQCGNDVRTGDRVTLAGRPGVVVFVIDTQSFSVDFPEQEWEYLKSGFIPTRRVQMWGQQPFTGIVRAVVVSVILVTSLAIASEHAIMQQRSLCAGDMPKSTRKVSASEM